MPGEGAGAVWWVLMALTAALGMAMWVRRCVVSAKVRSKALRTLSAAAAAAAGGGGKGTPLFPEEHGEEEAEGTGEGRTGDSAARCGGDDEATAASSSLASHDAAAAAVAAAVHREEEEEEEVEEEDLDGEDDNRRSKGRAAAG